MPIFDQLKNICKAVTLMYRNFCIALLVGLGLMFSFSSPASAQSSRHQWGPDTSIPYGGFRPVHNSATTYYQGGRNPKFASNNRGGGYGGRGVQEYVGFGQTYANGYRFGEGPEYSRHPGSNTGSGWFYWTRNGPRPRIDHPANWGNYALVANSRGYEIGRHVYDYGGYQRKATVDTYPQILWNYLTNSETHYKNWSTYPDRETDGPTESGPHGSLIKTYGNRNAMRNVDAPADQSLIVLESYAQDGEDLQAVNVMFRVVGYYPEHNDWYWVQYDKNGKVSRLPSADKNTRTAGRVQSCIQCHAQAAGGDYVHSNE